MVVAAISRPSMLKASTQPDLSVCKAEVVVLRAKLIDFFNNKVHATMVEFQTPVSLPFYAVVGHG